MKLPEENPTQEYPAPSEDDPDTGEPTDSFSLPIFETEPEPERPKHAVTKTADEKDDTDRSARATVIVIADDPTSSRPTTPMAPAPELRAAALAQLRATLDASPRDADALEALHALYVRAGAVDEAYCVAAVASFVLGARASAALRAFLDAHRPERLLFPRGALDDAAWSKLLHPDADPATTALLHALAPPLAAAHARAHDALGFAAREAHDPTRSTLAVVNALRLAADALGTGPLPALYVRPKEPVGLVHAPADPPATVVGARALGGMTSTDLRFAAARHAALYRPSLRARALCASTGELEPMVTEALRLVSGRRLPAATGANAAAREALHAHAASDPGWVESLREAVHVVEARRAPVDLRRWLRAAELTANRAALLLAGDLPAARRALDADRATLGDARVDDALTDLLRFAASDAYFALRRALALGAT